MPRSLSQRDRSRLINLAKAYTERECRRRGIQCWNASGDDYTAKAQDIFNNAYDYYESELLAKRCP